MFFCGTNRSILLGHQTPGCLLFMDYSTNLNYAPLSRFITFVLHLSTHCRSFISNIFLEAGGDKRLKTGEEGDERPRG